MPAQAHTFISLLKLKVRSCSLETQISKGNQISVSSSLRCHVVTRSGVLELINYVPTNTDTDISASFAVVRFRFSCNTRKEVWIPIVVRLEITRQAIG